MQQERSVMSGAGGVVLILEFGFYMCWPCAHIHTCTNRPGARVSPCFKWSKKKVIDVRQCKCCVLRLISGETVEKTVLETVGQTLGKTVGREPFGTTLCYIQFGSPPPPPPFGSTLRHNPFLKLNHNNSSRWDELNLWLDASHRSVIVVVFNVAYVDPDAL